MPSSEVQPHSARSSSSVQESLRPVGRSNSGTARAAVAFAAAELFERQLSSSSSLEEQVPRDGAALSRLSSGRQGSVAAAGAAGGSGTGNRKGASGSQGRQPVPAAAEGGSRKGADGESSIRSDGDSSRRADGGSSKMAAEPDREGSTAAPSSSSSSKGSASSLGPTIGAGNGGEAAGAAQAASGAPSSSSSSPSNTAAAKNGGAGAQRELSAPELDSQRVTGLARDRPPKDARASIQVQPYTPEARNLVTQAASWAQERSSQVSQQWPPSVCTGQTTQGMHGLHPKSSTCCQRL